MLTPDQVELLAAARRAVLATIAPDGRPRLVPVCFAVGVAGPGEPVAAAPAASGSSGAAVLRHAAIDAAGRGSDPAGGPGIPGAHVVVWTPLDDKPKRMTEPRSLARVRDILARPRVGLLVDRWDEDWSRLGWLRLDGTATLVDPGTGEHAVAVSALRSRYPQYASHALESRPLIRVTVERASGWSAGATS